ncbi:hypothetical protein IFM89_001085 [Coptis chinensis]|uniref:Uncharacterized protein n=1 Tax=Coptis chinensis TaxID=261450 RepID=A0A835LQ88_9MAGN|nr:hypothetical protein IFM89_001085 [Coptis chinensis]
MTTTLPWHHPLLLLQPKYQQVTFTTRRHVSTQAFRRSDLDGFAKKVASGEVWKDAWRSANDGFEQLVYDAKKAAERIDRQYSVSRRVSEVAQTAKYKARELDREYEIGQKWKSFSLDFSRNLPGVCLYVVHF